MIAGYGGDHIVLPQRGKPRATHQVLKVRAGEAGRAPRQIIKIDALAQRHLFGMNAQNLPTPLFVGDRSEEHTSELQSLMRISYAVFCLQKKKKQNTHTTIIR